MGNDCNPRACNYFRYNHYIVIYFVTFCQVNVDSVDVEYIENP